MATSLRFSFENASGLQLAAIVDLPILPIKYFALYAHCFSCGKDILVAARIARSLAAKGIAVMRFDFTGIGSSEGSFEESNFTNNCLDIVAATEYMRQHYQAPRLLIGHSLGGTAMLNAAEHIPEAAAIVSIAAPASPDHVLSHFESEVDKLEKQEKVDIELANKTLTISRDFVADLKQHSLLEKISQLRKALLIFHSPIDNIVSINEASKIFVAAKHPKSFISLDKADHLITEKKDIEYIAEAINAWALRYIDADIAEVPKIDSGEVLVGEGNNNFLREVASDDHAWFSDEPIAVGGDNLGPDPYEQLLSSLGTCTSMTLRMYVNHKGWQVDDIQVELKHSRQHIQDCEQPDKKLCKIELIEKLITITGQLDEKQLKRLTEVADRCPVHKTLLGEIKIQSNFEYIDVNK